MFNQDEFKKYATKHMGMSTMHLEKYMETSVPNIHGFTPHVIEERQLNVVGMDVFSRLMMDRIIFMGVPVNDYVANVIQAQLLFLESTDPKRTVQMGAVLLSAGSKGKRTALPHARVMIHQPSGGMQGQFSDMEISYQLIKTMKKELYEILARHTGQSYDKIEEDCDRDNWMTAPDAKEYGLVDEVLERASKGENNEG